MSGEGENPAAADSTDAVAEIKEKFCGSWKVDRSECFEDFLREVGVNFILRKLASRASPTSEILVNENKITIKLNAGFMVKEDTFVLGEEFETDNQGTKCKAIATYEDGKIVMNVKPLDENIKPQKTTREIVGDELLLTMYIGEVVCKRYFKKLPPK